MTLNLPAALTLAGLVLLPITASAQPAEELRSRGLELGFNLDYPEAAATFRASIAADPDNLAGYRFLAGVLWSQALFQQGAITGDDFMGETASAFQARRSNPELEIAARELLRRTEALSDAIGRNRSARTPEAIYQVGAAYRFLSTLAGTIEGSEWRSVGAARRAFQEHQRVLSIDPRRTEAGLTVGLYRYWVSTLPPWSRLVARVAGVSGDRDRGIRMVEEAAATDTTAQASAMLALIVIYNKELRYGDALEVIARLQRRFPRNRLLWLEAANTQLHAGRAAEARTSIEAGLRMFETDARPKAFGELSRWRYHYGIALSRLNQVDAAHQQFTASLQGEGLDWVRDRARGELGKLSTRRP